MKKKKGDVEINNLEKWCASFARSEDSPEVAPELPKQEVAHLRPSPLAALPCECHSDQKVCFVTIDVSYCDFRTVDRVSQSITNTIIFLGAPIPANRNPDVAITATV